jgi:hypothetical protein
MENQDRIQSAEVSIRDESAIATDTDNPQRNHGLHIKGQKHEQGRKVAGKFRDVDRLSPPGPPPNTPPGFAILPQAR